MYRVADECGADRDDCHVTLPAVHTLQWSVGASVAQSVHPATDSELPPNDLKWLHLHEVCVSWSM